MIRLCCAFAEPALEAAFCTQRAQRRQRKDAIIVLLVFASVTTAYILVAIQADARAAALYPEGADAAAAATVKAMQRLSSRGLAAAAEVVVQQLRTILAGFPLFSDAWAVKAAYMLLYAPQLLLYHVLVVKDVWFGISLTAHAIFAWQFAMQQRWPAARHKQRIAAMLLQVAAWHGLFALNIGWWFPFMITKASTAEADFLRCAYTGLAAMLLHWYAKLSLLHILFVAMVLFPCLLHLCVTTTAWLCSIVAPALAAPWLHQDAFCAHSLGSAWPHYQALLHAPASKHIARLLVGVLAPAVLVWLWECRQRRAFLVQYQRQQQPQVDEGGEQQQGQQQQQQQQQQGQQEQQARQGLPEQQVHEAAARQQGQPGGQQPAAAAFTNPLYTSPYQTLLVSIKVAPTATKPPDTSPASSASAANSSSTSMASSSTDSSTDATTSSDASSLSGSAEGGTDSVDGSSISGSADGMPPPSIPSSSSTAGAPAPTPPGPDPPAAATQQVEQAVRGAVATLQQEGSMRVVHFSCTAFSGCAHAIVSLVVNAGMTREEQMQQAQQVIAASMGELGAIGQVQTAVLLVGHGAAAAAGAAATAGNPGEAGEVNAQAYYLMPVVLAVPQGQPTVVVRLGLPLDPPAAATAQDLRAPALAAAGAPAAEHPELLAPPPRPVPALRAVVVCPCNAQLLLDKSWSAAELADSGGELAMQLPSEQLQCPMAHVFLLEPVTSVHAVAALPLLLLPSADAAHEVERLFDTMTESMGGKGAAFKQHMTPYTHDMAAALGFSTGPFPQESSVREKEALLLFLSGQNPAMPFCIQLLGGNSRRPEAQPEPLAATASGAAAQAAEPSGRGGQAAAGPSAKAAAKQQPQQQEQQRQAPAHASLRQAVWGFEDAALEQEFLALKAERSFPVVLIITLVEALKFLVVQHKAAGIVERHPETQPWRMLFSIMHGSVVLSHLLPLCSRRLRRRREAWIVGGAVLSMAAAVGFMATAHLRGISAVGMRQLFERSWPIWAWMALALPVMRQVTVRTKLALAAVDIAMYVAIMWALVRHELSPAMFGLVLVVSEGMALAATLLLEWRWRRSFLRQRQLLQQQQQQQQQQPEQQRPRQERGHKPSATAKQGVP